MSTDWCLAANLKRAVSAQRIADTALSLYSEEAVFPEISSLHILYAFGSVASAALFSSNDHSRIAQHHHSRTLLRTKNGLRCLHIAYLSKAHALQLFHKGVHVAVHLGLHIVMQDKHAALFQYPQAFQQQGMLVRTHNVMIDVVAYHSIKAPVRVSLFHVKKTHYRKGYFFTCYIPANNIFFKRRVMGVTPESVF